LKSCRMILPILILRILGLAAAGKGCMLAFGYGRCCCIVLYQFVLKDQQAKLATEAQKEVSLRSEFEQKVQDAANLDAYRAQMKEMGDSFSALILQLPKDTEVPGLLDDISNNGQQSGLNFEAIDLQQEKKADFYVELAHQH
jgi:type IV pilus assembly protein PilO